MSPKSEQTLVGLFVLVAAGILVGVTFMLHGASGRAMKTYHAYFSFGGGLETGSSVRYSGGPKVGAVQSVRVNPQDASQIDITFTVAPETVVKTDSRVKIMSLSPLGDNHLEILPGSAQAAAAPPGSMLPSDTYLDFNTLEAQLTAIAPQARVLIHTLNDRATELKVTVARVNDLLNDQNRSNLSATLAEAKGMIAEARPQVRTALQHVNELSEKLGPLVDDLRKTTNQANETLTHVDGMISEDRPDIHQAILQLRGDLGSLNELTGRLNQTLDVNSENIDQLLDNMVRVTENLKEFTNTIKTRPYSLIRASSPPEHKTGERQ